MGREPEETSQPDPRPQVPDRAAAARFFADLARYSMPFGKYAGRRLYDLPHEYLLWFQHKGFPPGKLGELMLQVCSIKSEGADAVFDPLRKRGTTRPDR